MSKYPAFKLTGQTFGRLTVLRILKEGKGSGQGGPWVCQCECGEQTILTTHDLKRRHVTDCSCTKRAQIKARKDQLMKESGLDINSCPPLWISMELNKL